MPPIDQASFEAIQPELTSGESILWAAQPNTSRIFHREDLYLIPFSLLWGGFAIFWEAGVTGFWSSSRTHPAPTFFMLWGIPFVVIGQYMIWGRFIVAAWKKRRTFYALTNRRAVVVQDGWSRKTASAYLDTLPTLIKEGGSNGIGMSSVTISISTCSSLRIRGTHEDSMRGLLCCITMRREHRLRNWHGHPCRVGDGGLTAENEAMRSSETDLVKKGPD
jgi:hypothetical protein